MLTLVYGGTFDPVHEGHLALARAAADAFGAEVLLLPSGVPPHRGAPQASGRQRADMLQLAIAHDPRLRVDTRELERAGPSYTVDTLAGLRHELGAGAPLGLLLGADAFLGLPTWHQWERLPELAHLIVVTRPGSRLDTLPPPLQHALQHRWTGNRSVLADSPAGHVHQLVMPPHPASATAVRAALASGQPDAHLPAAVAHYIATHHLYR